MDNWQIITNNTVSVVAYTARRQTEIYAKFDAVHVTSSPWAFDLMRYEDATRDNQRWNQFRCRPNELHLLIVAQLAQTILESCEPGSFQNRVHKRLTTSPCSGPDESRPHTSKPS